MRHVFKTLEEMFDHVRSHPGDAKKKTVFKVRLEGEERFVLSGNTDQAIAAVVRDGRDVEVETVGLDQLLAG